MNAIYDNYSATKARASPKEFTLLKSEEQPLVAGAKLRANYYYRPGASNFPTIDLLYLVHPSSGSPILFMFRITGNRTAPGTNLLRGLRQIEGIILPEGTLEYFVVVTPEGIRPNITIPLSYVEGKVGGTDKADEPMDEGDEDMNAEYDEGGKDMDSDGGGDMDGIPGDVSSENIQVFHLPINMGELFRDKAAA